MDSVAEVLLVNFSLADNIMSLGSDAETWLNESIPTIGWILIAAFGIAVGFVAYKLIKRAINKA